MCCDEPTSGLDAFQAQRVVESLKKLAVDARRTVVCSIHQPRGSIVAMFDDLCLMANGRCVYQGAWIQAALREEWAWMSPDLARAAMHEQLLRARSRAAG